MTTPILSAPKLLFTGFMGGLVAALASCSGQQPVATTQPVESTAPTTEAMACQPDLVATKFPTLSDKPLRIGMDPSSPPFEYRSPTEPDKIIGFDIDLIEAVMTCHGLSYELVVSEWSSIIPSVQAGRVDMMWSNLYYNPERGKTLDYAVFMDAGPAGLALKQNADQLKSPDDLCGKTTAAVLGSVEVNALAEVNTKCKEAGKPEMNVATFPNVSGVELAVRNGRAVAGFYDVFVMDALVQKNPDLYVRPFRLPITFQIGVAVKKGNADLLNALYDGLKIMQENGTQKALMEKNGMDPNLQVTAEKIQ